MLLLFIILEESLGNIKLNGEVTGSDSLDVPLNVVVFLNLLDVVEVVDHEEGKEDGSAAQNKPTLDSHRHVILWNHATNLDKYLR